MDRLQGLLDAVVFNALIGNADAHAKNLSMLYSPDGRLRLAPANDLLATGYWDHLSDKMAMQIGGERRPNFVHARHWQRFCDEIGLNVAQMRRRDLYLGARARATSDEIVTLLDVPSPLARHLVNALDQGSRRIEQRLGVPE